MVSGVYFRVLDVGQGSCNLVRIYDDDEFLSHLLLIDLGTNSSQKIARDNLEWIREQILANNRYLDALIVTHGDTDHYNMIAKILPALGPPTGHQIGMVRYGGPAWRYKRGQLITTLATYTQDIGSFTPSQTGYALDDGPKWDPIWATGDDPDDVVLQLIIANTPHARDPVSMVKYQKMNAEAVNTKSVVLGVEWRNRWVVATGDATSTTLGAINGLLEDELNPLPQNFMMTVPHHGSRKTTYDLKLASNIPDAAARYVVDTFLEKFEPLSFSISAGEKRHHHPSMYLIEQFADHLPSPQPPYWEDPELGFDYHFITSGVDLKITDDYEDPSWPPGNRWLYATTQTEKNIYGTLYFKDAQYNDDDYEKYIAPPLPAEPSYGGDADGIPLGRDWEFRMHEDGETLFSSENQARAAAAKASLANAAAPIPKGSLTAAGRGQRAAKPGHPLQMISRRADKATARANDLGHGVRVLHRLKVIP